MFCRISSREVNLDLRGMISTVCEGGSRRSPLGELIDSDRSTRVQLIRPEHLQRLVSGLKGELEAAGFSAHPTQRVCISQRKSLNTPMVATVVIVKILNNSEICVGRGTKQMRTAATEDSVQQYSTSDLAWQNSA